MQPGLEFLAEASNYVSQDWGFVEYAKLIGISIIGIAMTYLIVQARRKEIAKEKEARLSQKSAIDTYIREATG